MYDASISRETPVAAARRTRADHVMAVALRHCDPLTVEQTLSLIDNVKRFPCIWKRNRKENVRISASAVAWANIAKLMKLPEELLRAKFKNLRDLFIKELKKTQVTSADDYNGKWRHFKRLWFLNIETGDQTLSENEGSEKSDVCEIAPDPIDVKIERQDGDNEFVFINTDQEDNEMAETEINANKNLNDLDRSDLYQIGPKRRRMNQAYTDDDCDMMFLKSLTPYFKLLTPMRKLNVRTKMQEIMLKEIERNAKTESYSDFE